MSSSDVRAASHELIDQIDERFLAAVYALLQTYERHPSAQEAMQHPIASFDVVTGTPRTASELTAILDEGVAAVRRGEYATFEDFKKESAKWGQRTK